MISAIFDSAAHVTVAGCLGAFFFKHTVVDRTTKAVKEAENITAGLVISELCISVAALVLASHRTAHIILSKEAQSSPKHNLAELNAPLICKKVSDISTASKLISSNPILTESCSTSTPCLLTSPNPIANDSDYCTSPSTCSTLSTPILPPSPVQNAKRLSIDSDTTLVDHDNDFVRDLSDADIQESTCPQDDDDLTGPSPSQRTQLQPIIPADGPLTTTDISLLVDASTQTTTTLSLGSIMPQIVSPQLKPPDTKRHRNFRPGRDKRASRSTRVVAVRGSIERTYAKQQVEHTAIIDHLEQLHNDLLADQTALVNGWAAAMSQLGLTSALSPASPPLHRNTPNPGISIDIIQD
ncbi:uncharacterized protein EDB93DRAFT_1136132 [Suillus bovinus]|uniref:uncharacterized protein n=1 Tax=Suillus bovinus TaxID=48563 RepID=UPI001B880B56|nr:uncharacterized protein EDB93DRAFT_1136132 [Suillus bovinus]KAG2153034.1 hypothetical protein EDB93DRAFT_1136132 [Suillus bovinus]